MRFVGPLLAFLSMLAFAMGTFFEVRDNDFTPLAWGLLGLLLLTIPTGIAAAKDLTNRDGRFDSYNRGAGL